MISKLYQDVRIGTKTEESRESSSFLEGELSGRGNVRGEYVQGKMSGSLATRVATHT